MLLLKGKAIKFVHHMYMVKERRGEKQPFFLMISIGIHILKIQVIYIFPA